MRHLDGIRVLTLLLLLGLAPFPLPSRVFADSSSDNLLITGLVSNHINLTYSEVETFPMIWEIASLQCVGASKGTFYNWTGIPIFYLLSLAGVQPGAKEVVFRAEDGFSSSLTIDEALHPTTILALKVNRTTLPVEDGYWSGGLAGGYPYKVVVPCRWGYKWVGWIDEIEVVDYDYKGFYESMGYSDEAEIPNCTQLPQTTPPYEEFNVTWEDTYPVTVFSTAELLDAGFNQTLKRVYLTVSSDSDPEGFVYTIIPKRLLTKNFTVISDNLEIQHDIIQDETNSYLFSNLTKGSHTIEISGMLIADVTGPTMGIPDGKVNMMDVGTLARLFGTKVGDQNYVSDYDINDDGTIDMEDIGIVARDFGKTLP